MGARFHWGYGRALFALGPLQASRDSIAPDAGESDWAQTYAAFEVARQGCELGGYRDAIDELAALGEVEEWRVHFLLALLRLGFAGGLTAAVDLNSAEASFRLAARHSQAREPNVAVQALAGAAFCALRLNAPSRACSYADAGERFDRPLPELLFLGAEARLRRDDQEAAMALLERALLLDRGYALRLGPLAGAAGDTDGWTDQIRSLTAQIWEHLRSDVESLIARAPRVADLKGNEPPAVAGRRLAAFVSHGGSLPLYDMLQTHGCRAELLEAALEGARTTKSIRISYVEGPKVGRVESRVVERQVREKVVQRKATLFRKEEAEWVTNTRITTETIEVKRASRIRKIEVSDGAGQVVAIHELMRVPRGTFTMGSAPDADMRSDDELRHDVTLTEPYYLGRVPVDQRLWETIRGQNPSFFSGDQLPVEQISFYDALAFCNALSELEGLTPVYELTETEAKWVVRAGGGYRLPTEAEWEHACRAGSLSPFWCGDSLTMVHATFGRRQGVRTTPWGQYPPSPWGFYDFHGNVWEWVFDGYDRYATGAVMDPVNDLDVEARVARGGSWASEMSECRSATRTSFSPWHLHNNVGFRLALSATDDDQ
jgi:formylglycine-generating enzyme required for sulfatase activity